MNAPANARADRVVVVDDDARIRDLLRRYLTQEGFEVLLAEDAKALNRLLTRETIDLIVLDLMLPGEDGLSICRRLRAANDTTPIIMLTAKVEDVDRIVGLEVGADDYLPKPFNPRELLARIHAVLRRRPAMEAPGAPSKEAQTVTFGPFEFDLSLRRLQKDGEQIAHRRVLDAESAGASSATAAEPRQAGATGARPRVRAVRPQPRRADLASAQDDRARSVAAAVHPDGVGCGLRVRAGRHVMTTPGAGR
jgi:DNA-binding response OmpR family regulator